MTETIRNETLQIDLLIPKPVKAHLDLLYNHLSRYHSAVLSLSIERTDLVLDASAGLGFGSHILSRYACKVIGLDVNDAYTKKAKALFGSRRVQFKNYIEFDSLVRRKHRLADKIVCIETFEHIPRRESVRFKQRLFSYLKPGGDLYLTAPLGENKASPYNKHHLNEPSLETLSSLFSASFGKFSFSIDSFVNSFGFSTRFCSCLMKQFKGS